MSLAARLSKHRILLQVQGSGQDAAGEIIDDWVNVVADGDGTIAAEVRDASGREFVAAGATRNSVTTTITIRYRPDVTPAMRAISGTDVYNIEAVLGQDKRTLQLMCSRSVP